MVGSPGVVGHKDLVWGHQVSIGGVLAGWGSGGRRRGRWGGWVEERSGEVVQSLPIGQDVKVSEAINHFSHDSCHAKKEGTG